MGLDGRPEKLRCPDDAGWAAADWGLAAWAWPVATGGLAACVRRAGHWRDGVADGVLATGGELGTGTDLAATPGLPAATGSPAKRSGRRGLTAC